MRVTDQARTNALIRSLNARSTKLGSLYEKMATQQEVIRPSDDPVRSDSVMRLTSQISSLEQNRESIAYAQMFMTSISEMIDTSSDQMARVKVLSLNAVNGTLSPDSLEAIASEVNQILENIVQDSNQVFGQRYIFGGAATENPPVTVERNAQGDIISVAYAGSANELQLPISDRRSVSTGATAQEAFIDSDVLNSLITLRDDLRNVAGLPSDAQAAALKVDQQRVSDAFDSILSLAGTAGSKAAMLDLMLNQTENGIARSKEMLSEARDADIAELTVDMQKEQMVYESLLSAAAQINRISLLDYL